MVNGIRGSTSLYYNKYTDLFWNKDINSSYVNSIVYAANWDTCAVSHLSLAKRNFNDFTNTDLSIITIHGVNVRGMCH